MSDKTQIKQLGEQMKHKDKIYLQKNWMKLKKIRRDLLMMTIAVLDGEEHYEVLKAAVEPVEKALEIMEKLIKEE